MARLDVPLVFCGYIFYTVVLLLHLTSLTVSQSTTDSSPNTTIAPTTVYNNLSVTETEATELFSSNYPSSSVSSNNTYETVSPSSSSMFNDTTSNSSIGTSLDSSIDMSSPSSSSVNIMSSSNNLIETMSLPDNPMTESMPIMQSSSDIVTVTSTIVYNSNSNNQNSLSQTTSGFQPELTQTTDILETNSPMKSTGLNPMTSMYSSSPISSPSSMGNIESFATNDLESSVSEYTSSSDIEVTSSIIATENLVSTSVGTEMTSTPIIETSSSVLTNSMEPEMASSSKTPVSSDIQSASSSVSSLSIVPSSTVIQTTSSSNIQVSSSVLPMTTTTTTTTTTPSPPTTTTPSSTTLPDNIDSKIDGNTLFEVRTELNINSSICTIYRLDEDLRNFIQNVLANVDAVRKVVLIKNGCKAMQRRKRAVDSYLPSQFGIGVDGQAATNTSNTVAKDIIDAFHSENTINFTDADTFDEAVRKIFSNVCNSDVCSKYYGYSCQQLTPTEARCISRCKDVTCSNHGICSTIVTDSNVFGHRCSCQSEEYYKYEGENCEDKRMKWELAVAIAAGSGGAVILILVFVLIICCCCKNKGDKYGYDRRHSYEPMSDVIGRSGPAYYRNDTKNQQPGFTNLGYDDDKYSDYSDPSQTRPPNGQSWNPEDSKDTYAKITEQLDQEKRFEIKRPQVSGSIRQNSSAESNPKGRATTGF